MNKLILPALLCCMASGSFAQVENGNLEAWIKPDLFTHPYCGVQTVSSNYYTYVKNGEINVSQVEEEDNSFMRIENISIENSVEPGFFIFGNEPTTQGEDLIFEGGFNITDLGVTGISMDMKLDIPEENPGFIIVQFKDGNTPVGAGNFGTGTYVFPLSGTQNWTLMSFDFDSPIDPATNKCVIGISSADLLTDDVNFADGSFIEIDNLTLNNSSDNITGSNFEAWSFITSPEIPANVHVEMDDIRNPSFAKGSVQSDYINALELTTLNKNGMIKPAMALMGDVNELGETVPTAQLQSNHSLVSFLYRYTGVNDDHATVKFVFYNDMNGIYQPVFFKEFELATTNTTMFHYDMTEDKFDSFPNATLMTVEFISSDMDTPQEGSVLIVDELELSGSLGLLPRSISPHMQTVYAYPNPTVGRVAFRFTDTRTGSYRVYNAQGMLIDTQSYQSTRSVVHHMADYPAGTYTFKFNDNGGPGLARVVKN